MNTPIFSSSLARSCPGARGVALVVTLMMMSILVMMVVGLAGVMRNEQAAARNLTYQVLAEQMADLGAREAMALVLTNSAGSIGRPSATGPGWILTNGVLVPLMSSNNSSQVKNLDALGANSLILSLPTTAGVIGTVNASWTNVSMVGSGANVPPIGRYAWWVDDEGTKVNLNAVGSNNTNLYLPLLTNFPISANQLFVDPVSLQTNAASASRAGALQRRGNYLVTAEALKDTNAVNTSGGNNIGNDTYRRLKGHVTVWSSNIDLTPWGTLKINLADLGVVSTATRDAAYARIRTALLTNAWTNYFGNQTLASKYGDLVVDQITANILAVATTNQYPVPISLETAYNADTNFLRHRYNLPTSAVSQHLGPYLNQVKLLVDSDATIPNKVKARISLGIEIFNPNRLDLSLYSLNVQLRKFRLEAVINPASLLGMAPGLADSVYIGLANPNVDTAPNLAKPNLYITMNWSPGASKPTSYWIGPEWNENGTSTVNGDLMPFQLGPGTNPAVATSTTTTNLFQSVIPYQTIGLDFNAPITISGIGARAYAMVDQIRLIRRSDGRVMDWVSLDDFSQQGNYRVDNNSKTDNGQVSLAPVAWTGAAGPTWNGNFITVTDGLYKNDPQVRFPNSLWDSTSRGRLAANGVPQGFSANAWKKLPNSLPIVYDFSSTDGSVTGVSYFWPDPVTNGTTTLTNHPHYVAGYFPTNGFKSVAQLGAIHTGLPWRTLRLQPTPSLERTGGAGNNFPPDWVLLDLFTATSPTAYLPMINANIIPQARGGLATNSDRTLSSRAPSLLAAMGTAVDPVARLQTNLAMANGVPVSLITNKNTYGGTNNSYDALGAIGSNIITAFTNSAGIFGWSANSDWRSSRQLRTNWFPPGRFALRGELLEVRGLAENTNSPATIGEDVVEGRLRSFLDLITTRSDTFTVWSAGQGFAVNTNVTPFRTNVMAEVRKQTVFQRVPMFNPAGTAVTNYQIKVLYTRNHVMEW